MTEGNKRKPGRNRRSSARHMRRSANRHRMAEKWPWVDVVNELASIESLLRLVPELTTLARLVQDDRTSPAEEGRDPIARWAQALEIDRSERDDDGASDFEPFSDLSDLPNCPDAVLEAARWRLRRLSRIIAAAARPALSM